MAFEPRIYTIERIGHGFLAMMARPVPGEFISEEFAGIASLGIRRVVSMLESSEAAELGLGNEETLCKEQGMEFVSYPMVDRGIPESVADFARFSLMLYETTGRGINTVLHCRAGIGRAGVVAAGVLLIAGFEPAEAFAQISKGRGVSVPDTEEQKNWISQHWMDITTSARRLSGSA